MADAASAAEQKLANAHKVLLKTRGLQLDFNAAPQPKLPDWLEPVLQALGKLAPVMKYVFWGGLALGVVMVVWLIVSEVFGIRPRRRRATPSPTWRPEPEAARRLLEEADALAALAHFDEAIHLLLFRSIDDLSGRRPGAVRPALTSRDIADLPAMPEPARDAFRRIADAVERAVFGAHAVSEDDFRRCRKDYEAFAFAEGWR